MVLAWCLNGAAQSMTWSPILWVFSEYMPASQQKKKKVCVSIATYGLGAVADVYGWSMLIKCLGVSALGGVVLCILAGPKWRKFLVSNR